MNISINSLSLLSLYSFSPLTNGYKTAFIKSSINHFFPTIFYNVYNFQLEKSKFTKGIGQLLYNSPLISSVSATFEYNDIFYLNNNFSIINIPSNYSLVIIRDCQFIGITPLGDEYFISLPQGTIYPTLYITSCIFDSFRVSSTIIGIFSKATKITHICFSNIIRNRESNVIGFFIFNEVCGQTFTEFIYSSVSNCIEMESSKTKHCFNFASDSDKKGSFRLQCINVSNSKAQSVFRYIRTQCATLQMNTIASLNSRHIFYLESIENSNNYCGLSNFFDINISQYLFYQEMTNCKIIIDHCIFNNPNLNMRFFRGGRIDAIGCVFDFKMTDLMISCSNCIQMNNPTSVKLAHFSTGNYCLGVPNKNASGCQNGNCPSLNGCPTGAFSFNIGDVTYTEKYSNYDTFIPRTPSMTPTNAPTATPVETPTELPIEFPTEMHPESPIESSTESSDESSTESSDESSTESPTESSTESPTESSTETEIEVSMKSQIHSQAYTKNLTHDPDQFATISECTSETMLMSDGFGVNQDPTTPGKFNEFPKKKGINKTIIGIIIGVIALILIISIIIIMILIKKKRNKETTKEGIEQPETASIKALQSKDTKDFNDSTDEDIDFWL